MARGKRIIEGFWDCQYCGTKKIRGGLRECPNCGIPRGEGTQFYMDTSNINYVKPEVAKTISKNPDWLCSFCNSLNNDNETSCSSCGASKSDSEKNYFQMKKEDEKREAKRQIKKEIDDETIEDDFLDIDNQINAIEKKSLKSFNLFSNFSLFKIFSILGACFLSFLLVFGLICLFKPKEDTLNVLDIKWERSISIEKKQVVKESDWSAPIGSRVYETKKEVYDYDEVIDYWDEDEVVQTRTVFSHNDYNYVDLGNGYFEEVPVPVYITETYTEVVKTPVYKKVPIYKTKYYYEIDKWVYCRSIDSKENDKNPYWGKVSLSKDEREGSKSESYMIVATNKDGEKGTYYVDFDDWNQINIGEILNVKLTLGNYILEIIEE